MKLLLLYFIIMPRFAVIVIGKQFCNTDRTICETLSPDLKHKETKQIADWWSRMSERKPIKCTGKPLHDEKLLPGQKLPIFQSHACSEHQSFGPAQTYSFKGKIDNFRFEGPGKFKLGGIDQDGLTEGTCFSRRPLAGKNITGIVGNFKEGMPHGNVKLELDDGSMYIGKFQEGTRHGFYRFWNASGSLKELGYYFNGKPWKWLWEGGEGVRLIPTFIFGKGQENVDESSQVLVLAKNFTAALSGEMMHNVIVRARYVKIDSVSEEDCFLTAKWTQLEGEPFKFFPEKNEMRYHQGEKEPYPFCPRCEKWNEERVDENLKEWLQELSVVNRDSLWQTEGSVEPLSHDALKLIDDIVHVKGDDFTCKVLGSIGRIPFIAKRFLTKKSNVLNGAVTLLFDYKESPTMPFLNAKVKELRGYMTNNELEGTVIIGLEKNLHLSAKVRSNVIHGPVLQLEKRLVFPIAKEHSPDMELLQSKDLGMVGHFRNGRPGGPFWIGTIGGGYLYGVLNEQEEFTGDQMAFIYPDMETAIFGRFENKVMKSGRKARIIAEKCDENGIKILKFSEPEGPVMFYSPLTNVSYGEGPRNRDPYEEKYVRVAPSQIPEAGEGVFAVKDLQKGQLVCLYAGFIYRNAEEREIYQQRYILNTSLSDHDRRWAAKYSIPIGTTARLEIPHRNGCSRGMDANSRAKDQQRFSQEEKNVDFGVFEHPRYGFIVAIFASKPISAGEELFAAYAYTNPVFPFDFPWYREAEKQYLKELRELESTEDKVKTKKGNQKLKKKKSTQKN